MKCPKCNFSMVNGCCLKCGYMLNGNYVNKNEIKRELTDIELFDSDYDKMNRNSNWYLPFILGPFYFSYKGFFLLGFFGVLFDYGVRVLATLTPIPNPIIFMYFIINRFIYLIFANPFCLYMERKRINKIKANSINSYKDILKKNHNKISYILISIGIYTLIISLIIIYLKYFH